MAASSADNNSTLPAKRRWLKQNIKYLEILIFIVISASLWALTALGRKYTDTIVIPVEFVSSKENKILVSDLPRNLIIEAHATGFELLKHKAGIRIFPTVVNLDKYSVRQRKMKMFYDVDCSKMFADIEASLGGTIQVKHIYPTNLLLEYSATISKKVAIRPRVHLGFMPQHKLSKQLATFPDSVIVTGPESVLDTISSISTVELELKDLSQPEQRILELEKHSKIKLSESTAEVDISVERFTEHQLQIPLSLDNKSPYEQIELLQKTVTVRFIVCLSAYSTVNEQSFEAAAVAPASDSLPTMLEVRLLKKPDNISVLSISPQQVDYLIKKKR